MKIGILHLSDFHICEGRKVCSKKIEKLLSALNLLDSVDEYIIIFSGDLANAGKLTEYKTSKYIIGKIIEGLKERNNERYINLLMVPGNHDLLLSEESRKGTDIEFAYDNGAIETMVKDEIALMDNYYEYSHASNHAIHDKILDKRFCSFGDDYKIQFNLINTALFSTLLPDDKELHYFPKDKIHLLKKQEDANICITVMHHGVEWFNWRYRNDLEKTIVNNSELLFTGHEHCEKARKTAIDDSLDIWTSCAGQMKFSDITFQDSFNIILINTDTGTFDGHILNWDPDENMYTSKMIIDRNPLQNRTSQLIPLPSYLKELKVDTYNYSDDFTQYFVFPKLISEQKNDLGKREKIVDIERFLDFINENKRILVRGSSNSGKSTLLKHLYCSVCKIKVPLYLSVEPTTKIKIDKFIKRLFEDQYGDDPLLYQKYQQLDKNKKIIIIDGWDNLKSRDNFLTVLEKNFAYIVLTVNDIQKNIIESIKEEIDREKLFQELQIKPFFAEKRNQLVRNICSMKSSLNNEDIHRVNKLIDSIVHNNSNLFTLEPAFIIRYTDYFIKDQLYDYTKGEAVFSKIFEYGIQHSIIEITKNADVDEVIIAFEEIAGKMYSDRNDLLQIEKFRETIEAYNKEYGISIKANNVLQIGLKAKIFRQTEDLSIYFANKNYLAYFVAKHLLRLYQSLDADYSGIEYALRNICFGINADIILFISYLSNNTRTVMTIASQAGELLLPWEELDFEKNNIKFIQRIKEKQIEQPTDDDKNKLNTEKETMEEVQYNRNIIEAKGLFEYNEEDIDKYPFRLIRAIKYTEMLCKALPAFNSQLKITQKKDIIEAIYSYPHKISYALLKPIDDNFEEICDELAALVEEMYKEKKIKKLYNRDDIVDMLNENARSTILSTYDHFAELCTSSKTMDLLVKKETKGINQRLEKLLIMENAGNTDIFLAEAENMLNIFKDERVRGMIKRVVRKHLLCNPEIPHNKQQQIIDKFFPGVKNPTLFLNI